MAGKTNVPQALSAEGLKAALARIGATGPALWAVLSTETSGCGFQPDGAPKILFERHVFHMLTEGRFDRVDPDVSAPTPGGYGAGGAHQHTRLHAAMQLDESAALQSASWGLGQIMGRNFRAAGFANVEAMVAAFSESEDAQLDAMATFMIGGRMAAPLAAKAWPRFARLYNGPDYAKNDYDGKLGHFCGLYEARGAPDVMLRAVQMYLTMLGYTVGGIDGIEGKLTDAAIHDFCRTANGAPAPQVGPPLIATLVATLARRGVSPAA